VKQIESIIETTLYTGYIEGEKPVSLLMVASVEAGKTELVKKFILNEGLLFLTDATAWGIITKYLQQLEMGLIKHIIIPDLIIPLEKSKSTRNSFIAFMSALIEEGIIEMSTYAIRGLALQKEVQCGLIACIAKQKLIDKRHQWYRIGFLSRMVPISWSYPMTTIIKIFDSITSEKYMNPKRIELDFPDEKVKIKGNEKVFKELKQFSQAFGKANEIYGFRMQKQLQTLLKANAFKDGRKKVTMVDYDEFLEYADYINLDYKRI